VVVRGSLSTNFGVQEVPDAYRTHLAIVCVVFLLCERGEKKGRKKKRKNVFIVGGLAAADPQYLGFLSCCVL
jgi:hypothetical protein